MIVKQENRKKVLICLAVGVLLFGLIRVLFFEKEDFNYKTKTDPFEMIDLGIQLEDKFGLNDVMVTEAEDGVLEVRLKTPSGVSEETLLVGSASIFGYVESNISGSVKKVRIIFTVNYLDAMFIEVECKQIDKWLGEDISDEKFMEEFRIVKLSE